MPYAAKKSLAAELRERSKISASGVYSAGYGRKRLKLAVTALLNRVRKPAASAGENTGATRRLPP
jgi:hypothetical protein